MECTIMRIDECCVSVSDGDHLPPPKSANGVPFITISNIDSNTNSIDFSGAMYVPREYYESIPSIRKAEPGDILYSVVGSFGIPVLIKDTKEFVFQRHIAILRPDRRIVIPEFLYYIMRSNSFFAQADAYAIGSAQRTLSLGSLRKMKAAIPSLYVQDRIVSILATYDNLIEINNKRIKVLEQMAETLYKEWFVRFRFPGHETTEFENGIPKGWEFCTVESLSAVLQRGISPDYDDEGLLTVISQKCIRQNIMDIRESRRQTKGFKSDLNLKDGDTVICSTGTGTLGRVGQVYGEYPNTTFDSHVTLVRARESIGKHFLYWTLKEMQPWFMNMGIGSTNQQELYRGTIKNAKALCPDNKIVAQFESIIETIHRNIILLIKSQESLIKQRDLLLPRLMSGKLEVL